MGKSSGASLAGFDTWDGAKLIPVEKLVIPEWNLNEMEDSEFAALIEEIRVGGFDEPCQVVPITKGSDAGKYLVLGGAHRVKALMANGMTHAPCTLKVHLADVDELALQEWSVKRNNIRGRINAQKYAALEKKITGKWQISAEAARQRMLARQELLKALKDGKGGADETPDSDPDSVEEMDLGPGEARGEGGGEGGDRGDRPRGERSETDGVADRKKKFAERRALLGNLKQFAQEVLAGSEDTVEHGYLYFGQGGQTHLVVNESSRLHGLISDMVAACKANSDKIDDFLMSAITKELPQWQ